MPSDAFARIHASSSPSPIRSTAPGASSPPWRPIITASGASSTIARTWSDCSVRASSRAPKRMRAQSPASLSIRASARGGRSGSALSISTRPRDATFRSITSMYPTATGAAFAVRGSLPCSTETK